jgi:hypothetical protein
MNPKVASMAARVEFDAADYVWLDLTECSMTDAEIYPHMQELQFYSVAKMPMIFEKMAVIVPESMGHGVATLERVNDTLHFELHAVSGRDRSLTIEARMTDHSEHPGEKSVSARVDEQVMQDLSRQYGGREIATKMVTGSVGRIVANVYSATMVARNVAETYRCPHNPVNAKRVRKKKLPLYEWKTIVIDPSEVKRVRDEAAPHRIREKCREHEVRGHWAVRKRTGRRYWVRAHKRGDPSKGSVFHDYQLKGG